MQIEKSIKKQILLDWANSFPQLSIYDKSKLYKVIGRYVAGIELLENARDQEYVPCFRLYPLYGSRLGNDVKSCLTFPPIYYIFTGRRGVDLSIPYRFNDCFIKEAIISAKKHIDNIFDGDIRIGEILNLFEEALNMPTGVTHSGMKAAIYELKVNACIYTNSPNRFYEIIKDIKQHANNWDMDIFTKWHGPFKVWIDGLENKIHHREELLTIIRLNRSDSKLAKINFSELTS